MSDSTRPETGSITWHDLTVQNAEEIRDFYSEVVGWQPTSQDMGGYDDFNMNRPSSGSCVAGVCHARGGNADFPAQWLMYITVGDLEHSLRRCVELGGVVIAGPKKMGADSYCVIQDPAGAVAALYQHGDD